MISEDINSTAKMIKMYKVIIIIQLLFLSNFLFGQKLKKGDIVDNFSFTDVSGKQYEYNDFQDKKVIVAFFRYAGCPISNFRIHELKEEYHQLVSEGFEVVVIFNSTANILKEYAIKVGAPFIFVADSELKLYKKFAIEQSFGKMLKTVFMKKGKKLYEGKKYKTDGARTIIPSEFILEKGRVQEAYYGNYVGDFLPIYRINQF